MKMKCVRNMYRKKKCCDHKILTYTLQSASQRQEADSGQNDTSTPDLDRTGHSSGRPSDDDEDDHGSIMGLRNRRSSSASGRPSEPSPADSDAENSPCDQAESFQVRTKLGQTVYWSSQYHYSTEELEPHRQVGDEEMDDMLELCASEGAEGAGRFDDIVRLSAEAAKSLSSHDEAAVSASPARRALSDFHNRYSTPPSFVDWEQLQRGIDIFVTYAPAAGTSLYYRSLVGFGYVRRAWRKDIGYSAILARRYSSTVKFS